jgi:hypothetical protein
MAKKAIIKLTLDTSKFTSASEAAAKAQKKINDEVEGVNNEILKSVKYYKDLNAQLIKQRDALSTESKQYKELTVEIKKNNLSILEITKNRLRDSAAIKGSFQYYEQEIAVLRLEQKTVLQTNEALIAHEKRIQALRAEQRKLTNQTRLVGKGMSSMSSSAGLAGATATELGRTIGDANYGIQGMSNNIQQVTSLFTNLVIEQGSVKNAMSSLRNSIMGPAGILIAVSLITTAWEYYDKNIKKSSKATKNLKDDIKELTKAIIEQEERTTEAEASRLEKDIRRAQKYDKFDEELYQRMARFSDINFKEIKNYGDRNRALNKLVKDLRNYTVDTDKATKTAKDFNEEALKLEVDKILGNLSDVEIAQEELRLAKKKYNLTQDDEFEKTKEYALLSAKVAKAKKDEIAKTDQEAIDKKKEADDLYRERKLDADAIIRETEIDLMNEQNAKKAKIEDEYEENKRALKLAGFKEDSEQFVNLNKLYKQKIQDVDDEYDKKEADAITAFKNKIENLEAEDFESKMILQRERALEELKALEIEETEKGELRKRITALYDEKIKDNAKKTQDKKVQDSERAMDQLKAIQMQGLDNAAKIAGEESNIAKLLFAIKQALIIKEMILKAKTTIADAGQTVDKAKLSGARAKTNIAEGTTEAVKTLNPAIILAYAATAATVMSSVMSAVKNAKRTSAQVASSAGGSISSGGSIPSAPPAPPIPPAFNIVGASSENQLAEAIAGTQQRPIKTYVVSKDVSTAQELDRNIVSEASI